MSRPAKTMRAVGSLMVTALREWVRDRCNDLAACMAFNLILAIAPFIAGVVFVCTKLLGDAWVRIYVFPPLLAWVGPRGIAVLKLLYTHAAGTSPAEIASLGALAAASLLIGTVGFFLALQNALETIWNVRREIARVRVQLLKRARGLLIAVVSMGIALVGLVAAGAAMAHLPGTTEGGSPGIARLAAEAAMVFLVFWALVTLCFMTLPPVRLRLRQVVPWAALVAALHLLGRLVLTWQAEAAGPGTDEQLAESLLLVMLWFFYASMVFLYGAQLMRLHLQRRGVAAPVPEEAPTPEG